MKTQQNHLKHSIMTVFSAYEHSHYGNQVDMTLLVPNGLNLIVLLSSDPALNSWYEFLCSCL